MRDRIQEMRELISLQLFWNLKGVDADFTFIEHLKRHVLFLWFEQEQVNR